MLVNPHRFSSSFVPTDIAGLEVWFDASDSSTLFDATTGGSTPADDADVMRWEDKSDNANHATQGTADNCPHRLVAEENGLDAVGFDGSNDFFDLASSITVPTNYTFFVVFRRASSGISSTSLSGAAAMAMLWYSDNKIYSRRQTGTGRTTAKTDTGFFLGMTNWDGSNYLTELNGVDQSPAAAGGTGTSYDYIGRWATSYNSGNLCEIVLYDSDLSASDFSSVETYLANKWGITI